MLYHLLYPLHLTFTGFNVFRYISFRVAMAMLTALLISFLLGPLLIRFLKKKQIGEKIRTDGPQSHQGKSGTPTMGGVLIVFSLLISCLLWARLDKPFTWVVMITTAGYALIGFFDDYCKLHRERRGLTMRRKLQLQALLSVMAVLAFLYFGLDTRISFPFLKDITPALSWWFYVPFAALVLIGSSNAVNLTDGLDGLAIGPVMIAGLTYMIFAYVAGHVEIAEYLQIANVKDAGELAVFCAAMVGAGLGFLWFNTYPAQVFMGDVGSLSLGAAIGSVALVTKQELLLVIVGGIFVMEAVSVLIQVISFRTTGKRIFRMAPLHHHFELKGWAEPKVIVRFWIISVILSLIALSTLKLR